jgi:hypothetical protein
MRSRRTERLRAWCGNANQRVKDLDEFAEVVLAIFVALTLLIWLLTPSGAGSLLHSEREVSLSDQRTTHRL